MGQGEPDRSPCVVLFSGHLEEPGRRQYCHAQAPGLVQLAAGVLAADQIIGLAAHQTAGPVFDWPCCQPWEYPSQSDTAQRQNRALTILSTPLAFGKRIQVEIIISGPGDEPDPEITGHTLQIKIVLLPELLVHAGFWM